MFRIIQREIANKAQIKYISNTWRRMVQLPQFDLFYSSTLYGPYFVPNSCWKLVRFYFFRVDCEISGFFYRCDIFVFVFATLKSVNLRLIREFFMVFTIYCWNCCWCFILYSCFNSDCGIHIIFRCVLISLGHNWLVSHHFRFICTCSTDSRSFVRVYPQHEMKLTFKILGTFYLT